MVAFALKDADATGGGEKPAAPLLYVGTVIVAAELLNVPLAPLAGAVKVTFTPATGLLPASSTVTARAFANVVLIGVLCGVVPEFSMIVAGAPPSITDKPSW